MTKKSVDISVVLAAHHEGLLAHKTVRSLLRAFALLDAKGISHELVVTIDNGNTETINYFREHPIAGATIITAAEGDLGGSRNLGISHAKGSYIATLDADDLISENWLLEAYNLLKQQDRSAVIHTEYSVNFGTADIIWHKYDARSKPEDAVIMVQANRWDSALMAPREVFASFPYQPNTQGFGSEDWHFNSQTLAADIPHLVAPRTVLFVRRKDVSEMTIQAAERRTVRYTELLDFGYIRGIDADIFGTPTHGPNAASTVARLKSMVRPGARALYRSAAKIPIVHDAAEKVKAALKPTLERQRDDIPSWLIDEWRKIHVIERSTFPSNELLQRIPVYESEMHELGRFYTRLVKHTSALPDYIILVPYLQKGGADLVAINYANTLHALHPEWHIAVIATEDQESPWAGRLDQGIDFIPFGRIAGGLPVELKLQTLARFIVQSKCHRLHIIQSPLAFQFASSYAKLLRENDYTVYACAFCEDTDNEGRVAGHIHSGLPGAYPSIDRIFTDNNAIIGQLAREYAFDAARFTTHYQPTTPQDAWEQRQAKPIRILWAGRIAKQKRPDLLIAIAQRLDPALFQIDVFGTFQDGYTEDMFAGIPCITYKGNFNGLLTLPLKEYHAYLYTSENDGLPNTLLEVASVGLPTIASDVGGIGELIVNNKTGILVTPFDNVQAFVGSLEAIAGNPSVLDTLSSGLHKKARTQHNQHTFEQRLREDIR